MTTDESTQIFEYWRILKSRWRFVVGLVSLAALGSTIFSLSLPMTFRAQTTIFPLGVQSQQGGMASLASSLGLGGLVSGGGGGIAGQFLAVLRSRALAELVLKNDAIVSIVKTPDTPFNPAQAAATLREMITALEDPKTQTITIAAVADSPENAAKIANSYAEALQLFLNERTLTTAKWYRLFLEKQLAQNKEDLLTAGKELNSFYRDSRVSSVESKLDVTVTAPNLSHLLNISTLTPNFRDELDALTKKKQEIDEQLNATAVVRDVPQQVYLQYLSLRRELLVKLNALLTQQYEMAKMEEVKNDLAFLVLDPAIPPTQQFSPNRRQIVVLALVFTVFASVTLVFALEWLKKVRAQLANLAYDRA